MKLGEKAYFCIPKSRLGYLKDTVVERETISPSDEDHLIVDVIPLSHCHDFFIVSYIHITFLERIEITVVPFEESLKLIEDQNVKGNLLYRKNEYKKALRCYKQACVKHGEIILDDNDIDNQRLKLNQLRIKLSLNISRCHLVLKQFKECIANSERILKLDPKNYNAYYLLSRCYDREKDYARALNCIDEFKSTFMYCMENTNLGDEFIKKEEEMFVKAMLLKQRVLVKKEAEDEKSLKSLKKGIEKMFSTPMEEDDEDDDKTPTHIEDNYVEWEKMIELDRKLGRKPWITGDGTIIYQKIE